MNEYPESNYPIAYLITIRSYGTQSGLIEKDKTVWARGKSRRYLWKPRHAEIAIDYVLYGQGNEIPKFD